MITSYEVGAIFKIIDQASPALRRMLAQVRELNKAVEGAKASIASIASAPGLAAAISEVQSLAVAWREVRTAATGANRAMAAANRRSLVAPSAAAIADAQALAGAWERIAVASAAASGGARQVASATARGTRGAVAGAALGGGGGRHQPGFMARMGGGGGAHISGPAMAVPGGGHMRFGGGAGMAAAGLLGYGAYEAAQMEDAVWQLIYHSGGEQNAENRGKFRKILQDAMGESGYSLHDISESAKQEIRMFQGTPGGGIDVLPEMLRTATIEARLKGESPEESMKALIGYAHMLQAYTGAAVLKLAPAFAFLSTANPDRLGSMERASGYAIPMLRSGLEIDPIQTLLLGTALTRAGATSTKSGTWLREMALRAMPGTSMMSKMAFRKHEEALKAFGLVDDQDKPTWFTDGKPDLLKMLDIAGARAGTIPIEKRAAYERALFGAQGGGGFALLADPAVREQVQALQKEMNSPEFKNRYAGFVEAYREGSTVQQARTAVAEFNNTLMDIGAHTLPAVNGVLKDFRAALEGIRGLLPSGTGGATIGKRAMEGAAVGGGVGFLVGGPQGAAIGAAGGGVLGSAFGFLEQQGAKQNRKETEDFLAELRRQNMGAMLGSPGVLTPPPQPQPQRPIQLNLNVDGRALAQAIGDAQNGTLGFPTQAPAADGLSQFNSGDHNFPDK